MTKWTYLIAAVFLCTAALTACSTSNNAGAAPGQGNMAAQGSQDSMDSNDSQGSMDAQASQEDMDAQASQGNMDAQTTQGESVYHKISAEEAKTMMDKGGVTVVDVRREDEYAAGHIPGSILVPNEGIRDTQPEELPDLDAVLLVHCRTGVRSKQASDKLLEIGYKNVYDFGGIVDWPYETVTED
ncbi:rhodanese-like domain-containing protein [Enterocloster hominis (ex Hitch et al. 2024)]|uniref:Rhodanese-like domain-containing protein n=1 Tax=Enterocloster hominis (ex Hitch et al. 2024) TaxID=1917870 RepID=A0ABV1D5C4_9FIRM